LAISHWVSILLHDRRRVGGDRPACGILATASAPPVGERSNSPILPEPACIGGRDRPCLRVSARRCSLRPPQSTSDRADVGVPGPPPGRASDSTSGPDGRAPPAFGHDSTSGCGAQQRCRALLVSAVGILESNRIVRSSNEPVRGRGIQWVGDDRRRRSLCPCGASPRAGRVAGVRPGRSALHPRPPTPRTPVCSRAARWSQSPCEIGSAFISRCSPTWSRQS